MLVIILFAFLLGDGKETQPETAALFLKESLVDSSKDLHFSPIVRKTSALPPLCSDIESNEITTY